MKSRLTLGCSAWMYSDKPIINVMSKHLYGLNLVNYILQISVGESLKCMLGIASLIFLKRETH